MSSEYLLFNIAVIAGPLALSFDREIRFVRKWHLALASVVMVSIPFLVWDMLVTDMHWQFNPTYTMGISVLRLPLEEWLFFLTVPFACLFTWEVMSGKNRKMVSPKLASSSRIFTMTMVPAGIIVMLTGTVYTSFALIAFGLVGLFDWLLNTRIFSRQVTYKYTGIISLFILVFNGYLTARPVVLYNDQYITTLRIFTIPVEDFFYGFALTLLAVILYERLKEWQSSKSEFVPTSRTTRKQRTGITNE